MRKLLIILIPLAVCAAGCLSPEQQLVGTWTGKVELGESAKSLPNSQMASGYANMIQPKLDLRPDKTFTLTLAVAPVDGTWRRENNELILTPKKVMGMSTGDIKKKADKEFKHAKSESNDMPFPFPTGDSLPALSEMNATVGKGNDQMILDPGAGTFLSGFGKIVFKKV
jgi:hypothetical protein